MNQMRSSQKNRNARNKNGRNKPHGNVVNRVYESAGPEGKVRGTPQQIIEKYLVLARDAQTSGDRVTAENFLQHAEHYIRLLNAAMPPQDQMRMQGQQPSQDDGDGYEDMDGDAGEPQRGPEPRGWEQRGDPRLGEGRPAERHERAEGRHGESRGHDPRQPETRQGEGRQPETRQGEGRYGDPRHGAGRQGERYEGRGFDRDGRQVERQPGERRHERGSFEPRPSDAHRGHGERPAAAVEDPVPLEASAAPEPVLARSVGAAEPPVAPVLPGLETIDLPDADAGPVSTPETMAEGAGGEDDKPKPRRRTRKPRPTEEVPAE